MTILTIKDAVPILHVKNARAVRRLIREDPTLPFAKKGKRWLAVEADLEAWVRNGCSAEARALLRDTADIAPKPIGTRREAVQETVTSLATRPSRKVSSSEAGKFVDDFLAERRRRRQMKKTKQPR